MHLYSALSVMMNQTGNLSAPPVSEDVNANGIPDECKFSGYYKTKETKTVPARYNPLTKKWSLHLGKAELSGQYYHVAISAFDGPTTFQTITFDIDD